MLKAGTLALKQVQHFLHESNKLQLDDNHSCRCRKMYKYCWTNRVWRQHTGGCTDSAGRQETLTWVLDREDQRESDLWCRTCDDRCSSVHHIDVGVEDHVDSPACEGYTVSDRSSARRHVYARTYGYGRGCLGNRFRWQAGSSSSYRTTHRLDVDISDDRSHTCQQIIIT